MSTNDTAELTFHFGDSDLRFLGMMACLVARYEARRKAGIMHGIPGAPDHPQDDRDAVQLLLIGVSVGASLALDDVPDLLMEVTAGLFYRRPSNHSNQPPRRGSGQDTVLISMSTLRSLSARDFEREFGSLHRSIFSSGRSDVSPFRSQEWRTVLLPYGNNMEEQDFRALASAAKFCGDQQIVVMDAETLKPSEAAVVISASHSAFEAAISRPEANLGIVDIHLFGRSSRWGCICAASLDDVAIVGGDSEFIARLIDALGGAASLRDRFALFSTAEWSTDEDVKAHLLGLATW